MPRRFGNFDNAADNPYNAKNQLDVNGANKTELMKLPGIGDAYADAIIKNRPYTNKTQIKTKAGVPAATPISIAISKDLSARGFKFVGPTIVYAFMQAVGMVNDHLDACHRHRACAGLASGRPW